MRLTKLTHACVRLQKDDRALVIDPGGLTKEADALDGADAILITHEHMDHLDADRLRRAASERPGLEIYTCRAVADQLSGVSARVLGDGDAVTIAGFEVAVVGQRHEVVHPDVPPVENIGFFVDDTVFHPGDAFTVPGRPVPTLLVPTNAPWMKNTEMIGYLREVAPERAYSVHDGLVNDIGLMLIDGNLGGEGKQQGKDFRRLAPGETLDL
ncbi:MAG TPA: MBL fold metallo-hydrolase [Streptosporangiaceae bacterium]|nr:MBL fold metallo-hydrolase [Streptosporangiaceae bacterium]